MTGRPFVDYYEALQISPNADLETIQRVHRLLAQRFHPDNQDSGNSEEFRAVMDAYNVLSDAERRAAYDVEHREKRRLTWRIFDQSNSVQGVEAERQKRHGVLALLYRKRSADPEQPTVGIKEMEELLGVPREHLEFTLWFLKEGQCVQRTDNARFTITLKGAEMAEEMISARPEATPVAFLTPARRTA